MYEGAESAMPWHKYTPRESNWRMLLARSSSCVSSLLLKYQRPCPRLLPPPEGSCESAFSAVPHSLSPLNTVSSAPAWKTAQRYTQWFSVSA